MQLVAWRFTVGVDHFSASERLVLGEMVTVCTVSSSFCLLCTYCMYFRPNSEFCTVQHSLIGFYNRDAKCLLCGTNWIFK